MINIEEPITFACGGIPFCAAVQTNLGKVSTVPELKLVMMKSSKERLNARSAAAAIPEQPVEVLRDGMSGTHWHRDPSQLVQGVDLG